MNEAAAGAKPVITAAIHGSITVRTNELVPVGMKTVPPIVMEFTAIV